MAYTATNSSSTVNTIALAENITSELDRAIERSAVTGIFSDGGFKAKFVGRGIVVLRELNMSAMGDYDRDTGFAKGSITLSNRPYQLSQDRGRTFSIDSQDADESGIGNLIGEVSSEFVRTKVVPEVDAYVLSKLVGVASTNSHVKALTTDIVTNSILSEIRTAMEAVQEVAGYDEELVCFIDSKVHAALQTTTELTRQLALTDFKKGDVTTRVQSFNGMPFIPVPSSRMKSAYTFLDGTTKIEASAGVQADDQTAGGFTPTSTAKPVGFLILPKRAACLVKKTEKTRIFAPDKNQDMDAWKMDYRLYYDVFVKNSMKDTVRALTYTAS